MSISSAPGDSVRIAPLEHLSVLQAQGADTVDFLQGQLTQDVKTLDASNARLTGYCTAKGRLLASAVVWKDAADPASVYALVDAAIAPAWQKRLAMFVLRAKVKLGPAPLRAAGVSAAHSRVAELESAVGLLPRAPWSRAELPSGTWIAAPAAGGLARWWWLTGDAHEAPALDALAAPGSADAWRAEDIAAGLPWISSATQDLFVPQTVNLELVGGVSFTKGCYPGQEIVARSHYLGKLKRRMFRGRVEAAPDPASLPASDVFHDGAAEPTGRVVNAAPDAGGIELLFESTLASAAAGTLHLGASDGPRIELQPLPYSFGDKDA